MSEAARAGARFSFDRGVPESASLGARIAAFLIDQVLVLGFPLLVAAFLVGFGVLPAPDPMGAGGAIGDPFVQFVVLAEAPLELAYFTILEARWGRTVGKVAMGLRVVSLSGAGAPTLWQSLVRNILRFLWAAFPFNLAFIPIDWYLMSVTEMDQRIGDLAGRTYVVRDGVWWPPD